MLTVITATNPEFEPRPLPDDQPFPDEIELNLAYQRLLDFQATHPASVKQPLPKEALPFRWLGFLLREAPQKHGLAREVIGCADLDAITLLSKLYENHLLNLCE